MPAEPGLALVVDLPGRKVYEISRAPSTAAVAGAAATALVLVGGIAWRVTRPGFEPSDLVDPLTVAVASGLVLLLYGCLASVLVRTRFHVYPEVGEFAVLTSFPFLYRKETRIEKGEADFLELDVWALGPDASYEITVMRKNGSAVSVHEGTDGPSVAAFAAEISRCLEIPIHERREGKRNTVHPPGTVIRTEGS